MGHKRDRNKIHNAEVVQNGKEKITNMLRGQGFAVDSMTDYQLCMLIQMEHIKLTIEEGLQQVAALLDEYLFDSETDEPTV